MYGKNRKNSKVNGLLAFPVMVDEKDALQLLIFDVGT
jgi:hypothetical protein